MKTKQYCLVENSYDDITVTTFNYTEKSASEIEKIVTEIAHKHDIRDDLDFDWGCPENIIHAVNYFDGWSLKVMVSK